MNRITIHYRVATVVLLTCFLCSFCIHSKRAAANEARNMGIVLGAASLSGLPLGMPPAELERSVLWAIPEDVAGAIAFSGVSAGKKVGSQSNRTLLLLEEPEVKHLLDKLWSVANLFADGVSSDMTSGSPESRAAMGFALEIAKQIPLHATSAYVRIDGRSKQPQGALICHLGTQAGMARQAMAGFAKAAGPDRVKEIVVGKSTAYELQGTPMPVTVGVLGDYLVLGVGESELQAVRQRVLAKQLPRWLERAMGRMKVDRPANLVHVNVQHLANVSPQEDPRRDELGVFGANDIVAFTTISGLDSDATIVNSVIETKGELRKTLARLGRPIAPNDLSMINSDARLAAVIKADWQAVISEGVAMIGRVDEQAPRQIFNGFRRQFGYRLQEDLIASLGDVVAVYESPSEGGGFFTGMTAVISVKDEAKFRLIFDRLIYAFVSSEQEIRLQSREFNGEKIEYLVFTRRPPPISPAWCIRDGKLIVSTFPQGVKAVLGRKPDAPSFVDQVSLRQPLLAEKPSLLLSVNEKRVAEFLVPLIWLGATQISELIYGEFSEDFAEQLDLDIGDVPSLPALARHLSQATVMVRMDGDIQITSRQTLPALPLSSLAVVGMFFGVSQPPVPYDIESYQETEYGGEKRAPMDAASEAYDEALPPEPLPPESSPPVGDEAGEGEEADSGKLLQFTEPMPSVEVPMIVRADGAAQKGDHALAATLYRTILQDNDEHVAARIGLGKCLYELDQYEECEFIFDGLVEDFPDNAEILLERGKAVWVQDRNEESIPDFVRVTELDKDSFYGWVYLALAHQPIDKHELACKYFDKAISLDSKHWYTRYARARSSWILERYDEAVADCSAAIEIAPRDTRAHRRRAEILEEAERFNEAIEDYSTRLRAYPLEADSILSRAECYEAAGKHEYALRDYHALVGLEPSDPDVYRNRGGCYMSLQNHDLAIADFERAVKIDADPWSYANLAICHENKDDYEAVERYYTESLKLDPEYSYALTWRAYARQQLKRYAEAKEDYAAAIKAGADEDIYTLGNFSWLLSGCPDDDVRDGDLALELAQKAHKLCEGTECWITDNVSAAYAELGEFDQATRWAKEAMKLATTEEERSEIKQQLEWYANQKPARFEE